MASALFLLAGAMAAEETSATALRQLRVGVLSATTNPSDNSSQGLYIKILNAAGMKARVISAQLAKDGALQAIDVLISGGGSGTAFNKS